MSFCFLHNFLPELAERETRSFTVLPGKDTGIPTGTYVLMEMFCDEPGCDCRRVFFSVHSTERKCMDAVIAWGWEDVEFYSQWMTHGNREDAEYLKGPSLNVGSPAAEHAPVILGLVQEMLLADQAFAQRIQQHYDLFRRKVDGDCDRDSRQSTITSGSPEKAHDSASGVKRCEKHCSYCGSTLGHKSDRTGGAVTAVYACRECHRYYCNECSSKTGEGQFCLRCDSILEKVAPVEYSMPPYKEPVKRLLEVGRPGSTVDYAMLGLRQEHVPELIEMATDMNLHHADSDCDFVWAPVHAWRALGQLGDATALKPLVNLLRLVDEENDDWANEEIPVILAEFGSAAIPELTAFLEDTTNGLWARVAASLSLAKIAQRHPDTRDECVVVLTDQLSQFMRNDEILNAFLISALVSIDARESAQVMECAFSADAVKLAVLGNWEDVQERLGLLEKRTTPRPAWKNNHPQSIKKPHTKTKEKRKAQKKARKKNRRK